ncbi:chromate resistance protein [Rhodocytophaga rosea]|uniref:Chromate resistance protein n=1 Tax=Rhodocytophaga rosea TaxID=2704465 RepID=A0A6C0GLY5_9BACT|nr:chromate resistance protein ChrB domain-containing protein [Rhodocytophaga rosea]QHT69048.1 chromate resistance protein [Rhodocytophaga rosea]
MKWITRERPKIDRIACPWLIQRFIDPRAEFIFVPNEQVKSKAHELNAIPFDIPGVELSHEGDYCSFDALLKKYQVKDEALDKLAIIVRAADTDRFDTAAQSAGLWAISAGLSYNYKDDFTVLQYGFEIYDALYSWAKHLQAEKHVWNPSLT